VTAGNVTAEKLSVGRTLMAFLPYIVVVVMFSLSKLWSPFKNFLASTDSKIGWPGSDGNILSVTGTPSTATQYTITWLSGAGTLLFICGLIVMAAYRIAPAVAFKELIATLVKLRFAILTVASVLGLAYVMNLSGQTLTIGVWLAAGTGSFFAFLSPILGWIGTAVTGSDTSANALFGTLQQQAGLQAGIDPALLVAANTSGGVVGKMISPQNLAIAATSVGLLGRESEIFRKMIFWSLGLLLFLCVLVYGQSTFLSWMV
jgi:lactate permease